MNVPVCFVSLLILLVSPAVATLTPTLRSQFDQFKAKYNVQYSSAEEEEMRFTFFVKNMAVAMQRNKENPHATFGANVLSDRSPRELKKLHSGEKQFAAMKRELERRGRHVTTAVPTETLSKIDWRTKGAVTKVKNQGQCGSCWSFSTTGNIEGQWFLAGNPLVALSEQELVSCDVIDDGCGGGFQDNAFTWLLFSRNGTITTEAAYPYVSGGGQVPKCQTTDLPRGAQIVDYADVARDENVMAAQVAAKGPLAICVDATSFEFYQSGILTNCISKTIDHAVLIVGYDNTNSPPYWIVKNSWGQSWGESGYIRVQKGTNQCLIKELPTTALVNPTGSPTPAPQVPPPPPGPTPAPAAPTPAPAGSTFTQTVCTDSQCTQNCNKTVFAQNKCIVTPEGNSVVAECTALGLAVTVYSFSAKCQGFSISELRPLNTCEMDDQGTYLEFTCPSSDTAITRDGLLLIRKQKQ